MSDRLIPMSLRNLLEWILCEEKSNQIFGISRELFFVPRAEDAFRMHRYEQLLETPLGVAAGPHTQLAQNIVTAWLTGARYIELKTVQTLDDIQVARPCIDMENEGYNCEWSQELRLRESFSEYLKAWILLHILKDRFHWGEPREPGFIFNMSVGYDLEGIQQPNVQEFLDLMNDAGDALEREIESLRSLYPRARELEIPRRISDSVTLSTMHGCPPEEIEKIGRYLIEERGLHTAIKLNPTLLGPSTLREILNTKLAYEIDVPDSAFEHDPEYSDAVGMIASLRSAARDAGVEFGLKLTNTLEVSNTRSGLPDDQSMVYMSGRALHPLSVAIAAKLQSEFHGELDISFSAGCDCFNTPDVLAAGIRPVTVCSDLLKPGGYARLLQYLERISSSMLAANAESLDEFILNRSSTGESVKDAALRNLRSYADKVVESPAYHAATRVHRSIKTARSLPVFDCAGAPCVESCAIDQDVPDYLYWTARGEYEKARDVILRTNPFPRTTGMVCDHLCQAKCTRLHYDDPVLIREIKRFVMEHSGDEHSLTTRPNNGSRVGIIGAGPSGLACAYFLALEGFEVEVYEEKQRGGGMASNAIPVFRLSEDAVDQDIRAITDLGVKIHYGTNVDQALFEQLRSACDYLYIAVGAQVSKKLELPGEDAEGIWDQLEFLAAVKRGKNIALGDRVAVIGGGNSAMDAARTARRLVGESGRVTVVYRRTRREMPADQDEISALLDEGIELRELTAPKSLVLEEGRVTGMLCQAMQLGEPDSSGRPRPVPLDTPPTLLELDSLITALGQEVLLDFMPDDSMSINAATNETQYQGMFAGGDAVRGAATLIEAIGDGKRVAETIIKRANLRNKIPTRSVTKKLRVVDYQKLQARRVPGVHIPSQPLSAKDPFQLIHGTLEPEAAKREAARCLYCSDVCNICVSVCPNRAMIAFPIHKTVYHSPGNEERELFHAGQQFQILNVADFCNECGNCTTFCPTAGDPWRDKPRFYLSEDDLLMETDGFHLTHDELIARAGGKEESIRRTATGYVYENEDHVVTLSPDRFMVKKLIRKTKKDIQPDLPRIAELYFLITSLQHHPLASMSRAERRQ